MLAKITLLTALIVSVIYPLCFWISFRDPLKNNFHKFHLGLPNVIGGVTMVGILLMPFPLDTKIWTIIWKMSFLSVSSFYWKKETPNVYALSMVSLTGLLVFAKVQDYLIGFDVRALILSILAGGIFCSALYAMNLGHWYLNVHGLSLDHLKRAVSVFWIVLGLRLGWDIFIILNQHIFYNGELIRLLAFLFKLDGFLIWVALIFGTLFPLISLFLVKGTLDARNTQSATGILYVILCSVLIGDITYKYYLVKFGVIL